ncbi:FAD-binding protein [Nocardia sp. NPDC058499]|uniref:FAD-binding protein n=1 Tax=Nocardia sp. NPDC058499 TaxID=3346530 RepID=UPI00365DD0EE
MVAADQFGLDVDRSTLDGGQAWIARMVLALDATGCADLLLSTRADRLVQDESGRVTGVVVTDSAGAEMRIGARGGVLLAAGGFERAIELRKRWQDMPTADWSSSHPGTGSGDAVSMLETVGAALDLLDQSWWCPATQFPNGHAAFTLGVRSGIIVEDQGRRFANEMLPYDQMGRAMRAQMAQGNEKFWFVFDERFGAELPAICVPVPGRDELAAAGLWHTADTVADLARREEPVVGRSPEVNSRLPERRRRRPNGPRGPRRRTDPRSPALPLVPGRPAHGSRAR